MNFTPRISLPIAGLLALAVAMGIGRFAFTPILPAMQADLGLTLPQGGWLASANYLGYLLGAVTITSLNIRNTLLLRAGLWTTVIVTAAMGLTGSWASWLLWRFLAGLASAWVFVGTASLCIARLATCGQSHRNVIVFSGIGSGIALAGLVCLLLISSRQSAASLWLWMAALALLGTCGAATLWQHHEPPGLPASPGHTPRQLAEMPLHWGLIACYGVFGFGYILPATFLPAQARALISDPLIFGLTWPIFGLAAAVSTLWVRRWSRHLSQLQIWICAQFVMAVGVLLPALWSSLAALLIASLCVGGTLIVITTTGMQAAHHMGKARSVQRQIAAMTASFALGQLAGPLLFSSAHSWFGLSLDGSLVVGSACLLAGLWPLVKLQREI